MGCFESKEQVPGQSYEHVKPNRSLKPLHSTQSPLEQPEQVYQCLPQKKEDESIIVAVPRPEICIGERERAELKVKNMRDKLMTNISLSEEVMRQDALLALRMRKEGKQASARVLLRKRKLAQDRIVKSETMLKQVMGMIDTLDTAKDNTKFVEALEQGTAAINEITKDLSAERVHNALADNNEAVEYVNYIGKIIEEEAGTMTDEQVQDELDVLAKEFDMPSKEASHVDAEQKMLDIPTQQPEPPQPQTVEYGNKSDDMDAVAV
ncbi:unnamed protein product [Agarophyton chilense]